MAQLAWTESMSVDVRPFSASLALVIVVPGFMRTKARMRASSDISRALVSS